MLAANSMLKALSESEKSKNHKAYNNDSDFSKALENLKKSENFSYEVMCSDNIKRNLFFNN